MPNSPFTIFVAFCSGLLSSRPESEKTSPSKLCHMSKLFLFLIKAPACLKASPPPKSFFSCYTFVGMCCLTGTHFSLSVSSPTCTVHWSYSGTHLKCHTRGSPLIKSYTYSLGQQNRTGRGDFCIPVTKWFKREDAGSFIPLWQCHIVWGRAESTQAPERNRNIAVFSLVMPGSIAGSSLQRPSVAAAAQAASFGATLRAQGRHRKPALKAGAGHREEFLHKKCQPLVAPALNTHRFQPEMEKCNPSQEGHQDGSLGLKCHRFKSRLSFLTAKTSDQPN